MNDSWPLSGASSVPLYVQLAELLNEQLETRDYSPGDWFSSEGELEREYSVSKAVVRPAIRILESDGKLVRVKGKGIYVAPAKVSLRPVGIVRALGSAAFGMHTRVLTAAWETPGEGLRDILVLKPKEPVAHITSVLCVEGREMGVRDSFIRAELFPSTTSEDLESTLIALNDDSRALASGISLDTPAMTVDVSVASLFEANTLGIPRGSSTFLVRYLERGRAARTQASANLELSRMAIRTDAVTLHLDS